MNQTKTELEVGQIYRSREGDYEITELYGYRVKAEMKKKTIDQPRYSFLRNKRLVL